MRIGPVLILLYFQVEDGELSELVAAPAPAKPDEEVVPETHSVLAPLDAAILEHEQQGGMPTETPVEASPEISAEPPTETSARSPEETRPEATESDQQAEGPNTCPDISAGTFWAPLAPHLAAIRAVEASSTGLLRAICNMRFLICIENPATFALFSNNPHVSENSGKRNRLGAS
uniref:Uncharacterized protein n=1 Tax=Bracon brevicornis TaxID=1563983 RepID=A0A6V7JI51_9HYME